MPRLPLGYTPPTQDEIVAARNSLVMTQAAFADALGVNARTVQKWELGETKISKGAWMAIQALQVANS
jgi:DNA-binding transcriptional regulator YiaG